MDFRVIREHEGDRLYRVGETRRADLRDVQHLIGKCLVDEAEAQRLADEAEAGADAKAGKAKK